MYLIVGANGFLGSYFIKELLAGSKERILATARNVAQIPDWSSRINWKILDVTDREAVQVLANQIKEQIQNVKVIYLAAFHHPDQVEKNPEVAWDINVTALSYFMNAIGKVESFYYPSTDSVYGEGGMECRLEENAPLKPANRYGRQKVVAEALVTGYGYHVVRYPFLIAPSLLNHKKHFYDAIVATIKDGKQMEMFIDSYRSSLDFGTVARLTIDLMEKGKGVPSIVNVSGDEALSKYDIGLMIADKYGVARKYIKPVSITESSDIFKVPRATATLLDNSLLKKILGITEIKIKI